MYPSNIEGKIDLHMCDLSFQIANFRAIGAISLYIIINLSLNISSTTMHSSHLNNSILTTR